MHAQLYLTQDWVHTTGIPDTVDYSASCADGSGNIYVTTNTLSDTEGANILTTKCNSSGGVVWEVEKDHADGNDYGSAVTVDASGNVYVAAAAWTSAGNYYDYLIIKYNSSGTQQWTATYNGPGSFYDVPTDIFVDGSGNVYVTGASYGSGTLSDFCTIKYNSSGTQQWASRYNYASDQDIAAVIKESPSGRIITIGASASSPGDYDFALIKYNQNTGAQISATRNSASGVGFDQVYGADVDVSGNILLTGRAAVTDKGYDIRTVKLDTALNVAWSKNFDLDSLDDEGHGLLTDESGNVYVTGWVTNAPGNRSMVTIKYNSAGTKQWHKKEDAVNAGLDAMGLKISRHNTGPIAVAGNLDNGASVDYLLVLYDDAGERLWIEQYDSPQKHDDKVNFVKADAGDTYYVGGKSYGVSTATNRLVKYSAHTLVIPPDDDMVHPSAFTFFENKGQLIDTEDSLRPDIQYYTHRTGPSLYFMDDTLSYVWSRIDTSTSTQDTLARVDLSFTGSNSGKTIHHAVSEGGEYLNYYLAHCATGVTQVRSSDRLVAEELYDHVDLQYYFDGAGLKYYLLIKPGYSAQNDPIVMQYTGAESVTILTGNKLEVSSVLGSFTLRSPEAYQIDTDGSRIDLAWDATFTDEGGDAIGLDLDTYDDELVLVIELRADGPTALSGTIIPEWATLYGGNTDDVVTDVNSTVHQTIIIAGFTNSTVFPTTYYLEYNGTDYDTFIQTFASDYSPVWALVFGGTAADKNGYTDSDSDPSVAINSFGDIYLTGATLSDDIPIQEFTPVAGSFNFDQRTCPEPPAPCPPDGYLARFNGAGNELIWSTYIGAEGVDNIYGITVNTEDEVILVGGSNGVGFDGHDPGGGSYYDATKGTGAIYSFSNNSELVWGTKFGGAEGGELLRDVTLDATEDIIVVGYTESISDFPITTGSFQSTYGGGEFDGFVAKFSSSFEHQWASYIGGVGNDQCTAVSSELSGNVWIGGYTTPNGGSISFPTISTLGGSSWYSDSFQGGSYDGFIGMFDSNGDVILVTYFGTPGWDYITDVATDGSNMYFVGHNWIEPFDEDDGNQIPNLLELDGFYFDNEMESQRSSFLGSFSGDAVPRLLTYLGNTSLDMANAITISGKKVIAVGEALNYYSDDTFLPLVDPGDPSYYQGIFNNTPAAINVSNNDGYIFVCTDDEIIIDNVETIGEFLVSIYPNPASNYVNVICEIPLSSVAVISADGRLLRFTMLSESLNSTHVDLHDMPAGVYFIRADTSEGVFYAQLILLK